MQVQWRRVVRFGLVLIFWAGLSLVAWAPTAQAQGDVNDFTINRFVADETLTRDDPQGKLEISEEIDVTFRGQNHGILRAIPNSYKNHRLQIEVLAVKGSSGSQWSSYEQNGNTVLKIGNPDKTVTGTQHYAITYTVRNVIGFYTDHDELYWDINGDQWAQPAEAVSVSVHLPEGLELGRQQPRCYTGTFGSTEQACVISYDQDMARITAASNGELAAYETLSIVAGFEKGYFRPSTWHETAAEYSHVFIGFLLPIVMLGGTAGVYWYRRGRDAKGRGVIVPEYESPDKLKPIEVGTIADFRTDNQDITATIIDLAVRGYIKIIETTVARKLRRDYKSYTLQLVKSEFKGLDEYETTILHSLFPSPAIGEEVELSTLKFKFATTASKLRVNLKRSLTTRGYFRSLKSTSVILFIVAMIAAALICLILISVYHGAAMFGSMAGGAIAFLFILRLPSRTAKGALAKEGILGLKLYLETAEADRLKMLQSPDAPYAERTTAPKRTVELFEKLLPYAIVLGVEEQWAAQFKGIYQTPPEWYGGHNAAFSAAYLASSLNSGVGGAVNTAFSSPSSSSGSGFSGGGSGGGGGGGGGGGW